MEPQGDERPNKKRRNWKSERDRAALIEECRAFAEKNGKFPRTHAPKGSRERHLAQSVMNGLNKNLFTERERAALEEMRQGAGRLKAGAVAVAFSAKEKQRIKMLANERGCSDSELIREIVLQYVGCASTLVVEAD